MSPSPDQAAAFLALHRPGASFVLPNVWDAGSARILAQVGFPALATTSAGIAFSHGVADSTLGWPAMLAAITRITAAVDCPVTADLESDYAEDPAGVADTVAAAIAVGVVGANLEDLDAAGALRDVEDAADRVAAARSCAPVGAFVLNARTDTYLTGHPDAFAETVRRAHRYVEAGADCVFVPGVTDLAEIGRLTAEIGAPVNVVAGLAGPTHDAAALRAAGVARISIGGSLTRAVLTLVERAGREMLEGTFGFVDGAIPYGDLQARLS
ncbi:isocitrate lyase/phosphoenolpyruvate mutase family protein [Nocardioides marmoriginsengisoli]|uniref:Isocitrate lyase/phosphoenolpyruvate mutase family protein n=1 Tax=Nocardioides marmoriginsengisoli TaxID=661483 RepID=A0A3N0CT52_9ACTN|nr:isocitrate lyase/phosphoenolpyruvate mutase family protein [Nocardioides marmoriginsengisoli]RNL66176.1 isocitrate lyase/phosphoenolpyruvate mutase family protein [Nocardioides marmoriginsengisoli]